MKLTEKLTKTETLSEIFRDVAQVFLASVMIDPIVNNSFQIELFLFGSVISFFSWFLSLFLAKE